MMGRRLRSFSLLALLALSCRPENRPSGTFLVDAAPAASVKSVELRGETRRAIETGHPGRLELELTLPQEPVLRFAIGAFSDGHPALLEPVLFRVLVDGTVVYRERLRRARGGRWFPREIELDPWSGKTVQVVLETEGGAREEEVSALWGNPVVTDRGAVAEAPDLILVSIDCLRADHVGSYGYPRNTTPNLDAFARGAVRFANAMATSSYTLPTHASMLTGLPPSLHGAMLRRPIRSAVDTLPELLARENYQVLGLVSAPFLSPVYGFSSGFHLYRLSSEGASGLVRQALELLDAARGTNRFLFLHLFDVHAPYSPPSELIDRFGPRPKDVSDLLARFEKRLPPKDEADVQRIRNLYDAEIASVDRELGRFFDELRARGLFDSSLIAVTADHGEAFYERGHWEHARPWRDDGPFLHQELLHVPLFVKWPGAARGSVVDSVVSQTDLFPTFLEAVTSVPETPWAQSLRSHLKGTVQPTAGVALAELLTAPEGGEASLEVALRRGDLKYVATRRAKEITELFRRPPAFEALYDLAADPTESRNLLVSGGPDVSLEREALRSYLEAAARAREESSEEDLVLDPELVRRLESLGYIEH